MARQKLNLHNAYVEGARLEAATKLDITHPNVGREQYASLSRRSEMKIRNAEVVISGGIGSIKLGNFEDENIQLEFCAFSMSLPAGYQGGLGLTTGDDLVPFTASENSRAEAVSNDIQTVNISGLT